jgi:hypothetical protein
VRTSFILTSRLRLAHSVEMCDCSLFLLEPLLLPNLGTRFLLWGRVVTPPVHCSSYNAWTVTHYVFWKLEWNSYRFGLYIKYCKVWISNSNSFLLLEPSILALFCNLKSYIQVYPTKFTFVNIKSRRNFGEFIRFLRKVWIPFKIHQIFKYWICSRIFNFIYVGNLKLAQ